MLSGGFPCPPRSTAGRLRKTRTGLCCGCPVQCQHPRAKHQQMKKKGKKRHTKKSVGGKGNATSSGGGSANPGHRQSSEQKESKGFAPVTQRENNECCLPKRGSGLRGVAARTSSLVASPSRTRGRQRSVPPPQGKSQSRLPRTASCPLPLRSSAKRELLGQTTSVPLPPFPQHRCRPAFAQHPAPGLSPSGVVFSQPSRHAPLHLQHEGAAPN